MENYIIKKKLNKNFLGLTKVYLSMLSNKTAVYEKIVDSFTEYMNEILCINHHFVSEKSEQNAEVRAFEKPCNDALRSSVSGESVFVSMGSSSTQPQKKNRNV